MKKPRNYLRTSMAKPTYPIINQTYYALPQEELNELVNLILQTITVKKLISNSTDDSIEIYVEITDDYEIPPGRPKNRTLLFATYGENICHVLCDAKLVRDIPPNTPTID